VGVAAGVVEGPAAASGDLGSSLIGVNELDDFCVSANALPNPLPKRETPAGLIVSLATEPSVRKDEPSLNPED